MPVINLDWFEPPSMVVSYVWMEILFTVNKSNRDRKSWLYYGYYMADEWYCWLFWPKEFIEWLNILFDYWVFRKILVESEQLDDLAWLEISTKLYDFREYFSMKERVWISVWKNYLQLIPDNENVTSRISFDPVSYTLEEVLYNNLAYWLFDYVSVKYWNFKSSLYQLQLFASIIFNELESSSPNRIFLNLTDVMLNHQLWSKSQTIFSIDPINTLLFLERLWLINIQSLQDAVYREDSTPTYAVRIHLCSKFFQIFSVGENGLVVFDFDWLLKEFERELAKEWYEIYNHNGNEKLSGNYSTKVNDGIKLSMWGVVIDWIFLNPGGDWMKLFQKFIWNNWAITYEVSDSEICREIYSDHSAELQTSSRIKWLVNRINNNCKEKGINPILSQRNKFVLLKLNWRN